MKQSKQPGPRRARRPRRPSGGRGRSLLQPLIFLLICAAAAFMGLILRVVKNVFCSAIELKAENDMTI